MTDKLSLKYTYSYRDRDVIMLVKIFRRNTQQNEPKKALFIGIKFKEKVLSHFKQFEGATYSIFLENEEPNH